MNRLRQLVPGAIFRHYKNEEYVVVGLATHTETLDEMVVYQSLTNFLFNPLSFQMWIRPKRMFLGKVRVNGQLKDRFEFISYPFHSDEE